VLALQACTTITDLFFKCCMHLWDIVQYFSARIEYITMCMQ
jgi:hypothetical protein